MSLFIGHLEENCPHALFLWGINQFIKLKSCPRYYPNNEIDYFLSFWGSIPQLKVSRLIILMLTIFYMRHMLELDLPEFLVLWDGHFRCSNVQLSISVCLHGDTVMPLWSPNTQFHTFYTSLWYCGSVFAALPLTSISSLHRRNGLLTFT